MLCCVSVPLCAGAAAPPGSLSLSHWPTDCHTHSPGEDLCLHMTSRVHTRTHTKHAHTNTCTKIYWDKTSRPIHLNHLNRKNLILSRVNFCVIQLIAVGFKKITKQVKLILLSPQTTMVCTEISIWRYKRGVTGDVSCSGGAESCSFSPLRLIGNTFFFSATC